MPAPDLPGEFAHLNSQVRIGLGALRKLALEGRQLLDNPDPNKANQLIKVGSILGAVLPPPSFLFIVNAGERSKISLAEKDPKGQINRWTPLKVAVRGIIIASSIRIAELPIVDIQDPREAFLWTLGHAAANIVRFAPQQSSYVEPTGMRIHLGPTTIGRYVNSIHRQDIETCKHDLHPLSQSWQE